MNFKNRSQQGFSLWHCILPFIFFLIFLCFYAFALPVYGSDEDGGANSDRPLELAFCTPADGSENVPTDTAFELEFTKNVCNVAIIENNKDCFHLTDSKGNTVPIVVTFPDDQIQRAYKRQVWIRGQEALAPNTAYRISVDNTLIAKNGTSIYDAYAIDFTTGKQPEGHIPETLEALGEMGVRSYNTALPETEASVPDPKKDKNGIWFKLRSPRSIATIIAAAVAAITIILAIIIARRRTKVF